MTAKLYAFPSGEQIGGRTMSGGFYVSALLVSFAVVLLMIHRYTR
jgi:hypothetical protein